MMGSDIWKARKRAMGLSVASHQGGKSPGWASGLSPVEEGYITMWTIPGNDHRVILSFVLIPTHFFGWGPCVRFPFKIKLACNEVGSYEEGNPSSREEKTWGGKSSIYWALSWVAEGKLGQVEGIQDWVPTISVTVLLTNKVAKIIFLFYRKMLVTLKASTKEGTHGHMESEGPGFWSRENHMLRGRKCPQSLRHSPWPNSGEQVSVGKSTPGTLPIPSRWIHKIQCSCPLTLTISPKVLRKYIFFETSFNLTLS